MLTVTWDTRDFDEHVGKLLKQLKNKRPALTGMGIVAKEDVEQHFKDEKGSDGSWEALSDITKRIRRKGKRGGADKILQDTGKLRTINFDVAEDSVTVGSAMKYGIYHQEGKGVPKREWLYLSKRAIEKLKQTVILFIKKAIT